MVNITDYACIVPVYMYVSKHVYFA